MRFIFEQVRTGGDRNFGYLIGDREAHAGALVDPAPDPAALIDRAEAQGLRVEFVINTHGHADHTGGNRKAKDLTGARIAAHDSFRGERDVGLLDGDELRIGIWTLRVFHVPGHADDHLLLYLPEHRVAITGDLLFVGKIGGTGSDAAARLEYESLQRVLRELPDDATVWPGHDYGCRPSSTIALEKATNPFLLARDIDEFLRLKTNWPSFKGEKGLR